MNFYRIEDFNQNDMRVGAIKYLKASEKHFWQNLISKYLLPLTMNSNEQYNLQRELKELKNMVAFTFFIFNSIWLLTIFLLQYENEKLYIKWIFTDNNGKEMQLQPIVLIFMIFFSSGKYWGGVLKGYVKRVVLHCAENRC